jgi:HK97 family phage portal protein
MKIFGYQIKRQEKEAEYIIRDDDFDTFAEMMRQYIIRGQVIPIDDTPTAYITQAFMRNPVVYALIMLRANAAKSIPWIVYKVKNQRKLKEYKTYQHPNGDLGRLLTLKNEALEEVNSGELYDLMRNPNGTMSFADLIESMFVYRDVTGNAYFFIAENPGTKKPVGLFPAPADKVKIIAGTFTRPIQSYTIELLSRQELPPEKVLHWKYMNPRWLPDGRDLYGMSPLRPAAAIIAQDNLAIDGQSAAFLNEGVKGIITGTEQTAIDFTPEQAAAIRDKWEKSSGFRNRGKVQFNRAPLNWLKIGESPVDLGTLEARKANRDALCNIFRIHPALMGADASTLDNLKIARQMLFTTSVLPDMDSFKNHFNEKVVARFGPEYWVDYDLMAIKELQEDLGRVAEMLQKMDWITDNEKRAATQYETFPDAAADQLYKPAGLVPLGMDFDTGFERIDEQLNKYKK